MLLFFWQKRKNIHHKILELETPSWAKYILHLLNSPQLEPFRTTSGHLEATSVLPVSMSSYYKKNLSDFFQQQKVTTFFLN